MSPTLRRSRSAASWLLGAAVTAAIAVACSTTDGSTPESATPSAMPPSLTPGVTTAPVPSNEPSDARPTASPAWADAPPGAAMSAEGGDPVAGRLGSYTWAVGGSDSPWLPGSPIAVGAGEPLTVQLDGAPVVTDWTATRVAAGTTDGSGAVVLATAEGQPIRFIAPAAGSWSIQVQVRFDRGSDSAAYYWLLDAR
jgi:hypothetical protein